MLRICGETRTRELFLLTSCYYCRSQLCYLMMFSPVIDPTYRLPQQITRILCACVLMFTAIGCSRDRATEGSRFDTRAGAGPIAVIDLNSSTPINNNNLQLAGARNEWLGTVIELAQWRGGRNARLRVRLVDSNGKYVASTTTVEQLVDVAVDQHRASFVRKTGQTPALNGRSPRALLPVSPSNKPGEWDLSRLRNPAFLPGASNATFADGRSPVLLWVDVHVPPQTPAGSYTLAIELIEKPGRKAVAAVGLPLTVYDFVLPDERKLELVARFDWPVLAKQDGVGDVFKDLSPRLLNRTEAGNSAAIAALDGMVAAAHANRANLFIPQLQPTVKWPSGEPPAIDWTDFDSVAGRWISGEAFRDRVPLGYWPLPAPDGIDQMDNASAQQYWGAAAAHFAQQDWLSRSAVSLSGTSVGRASAAESIRLSGEVANALSAHPMLRALAPLESDQVQFNQVLAGPLGDPTPLIGTNDGARLMLAAPGLVAPPPSGVWPREAPAPVLWLRGDAAGSPLNFSENDVRIWGWLAFLRDAKLVLFDNPLAPETFPARPLDAAEPIWFYPGQPFGRDGFVPSVQLKWLRRAQQDFEYLNLATQRGETINTKLLAQLLARPVGIPPTNTIDPTYGLLTGSPTTSEFTGALQLVARAILLRQPGRLPDLTVQQQLQLETMRWMQPQQQPTLIGRSTTWMLDPLSKNTGNWLDLRFGLDIYTTAAGDPVAASTLQWTGVGAGWRVAPQPTPMTALSPYRTRRVTMDARVDLDQLGPGSRQPLTATFTDGFTRRQAVSELVAPAAACDRRQEPLTIDGSLGDWKELDAITNEPLVKMLDRPSIGQPRVQRITTTANVYTNWTESAFNIAFRLGGVADDPALRNRPMRNFATYQSNRAWGEDIVEILVQPIYADNTVGPVLNISCKPAAVWMERKLDARVNVDPWIPVEGAAVRYAARVDANIWRGELAIPWKAISDEKKGRPVLLRFNFSQHLGANAQSGSWAGPIDFGRDDAFMGVLHVHDSGADDRAR